MADSFTPFLQVRLPATGAYNNTWGATLNSDALTLLDAAITGQIAVNIGSSTNFSLPALTPGATSQSRFFCLLMLGTPAGPVTVTVPSSVSNKQYLINNQTGQILTFTYGGIGDATVTVGVGELRLIYTDGTNCSAVTANATNSASLGGVPSANWVRQSRTAAEITAATVVLNAITIPTSWPYITATEAPTTTLDANGGNSQSLTLTGNRVMAAVANARDGAEIDLLIVQDGTGNRTLSWNAVFVFENGIAPVLGTAPGAIDRLLMKFNAALGVWTCGHFGNLNTGAGTTLPITIASNTLDWNLTAIIGTLTSPATINILVQPGVIIEASNPLTPAVDLSGLISGCTVNLVNKGYILGHGGDGGAGAEGMFPGSGASARRAGAGQPGGRAILGPGSGCTLNITNGNGFIWGGGGGGGGGGASISLSSNGAANGGGGGAGAGGARGGPGGRQAANTGSPTASDGGSSGNGPNGVLGAAGSPGATGTGHAQPGGAGGDWGAAGAAGTADTTNPAFEIAFGAAGAAGKAAELSGGTATFVSGAGTPSVKGVVS
jgi:hypothetical protein